MVIANIIVMCVCAWKAYIMKKSFYWNGTKAKILASYFQSDAWDG